jgi:geranylgeranyl diphosphate synthase type II
MGLGLSRIFPIFEKNIKSIMHMLNIQECQSVINRQLNELKLPGLPSNLYEPIRYMLDLEAKRLRPSLVIMGCNIFSENIQPAIFPALAIEVFHNFTLMHDDIMDKSAMRRNNPAVHMKWNPNVAILSGDAMVIKAYELLAHKSENTLQLILPVFNQTALQVCEGQQYDMDYEHMGTVSIDDYLKMIEYKTAVLLAASLKIGALLGGAGNKEADLLYEFGRNIGMAFQLQDDLFDVFADPAVFGKVTGNDIVSNKKTILLIEALNVASGGTRQNLLEWLNKRNFDREEKIQAIRSIYNMFNIEQSVNKRISHYHQLAVESLEKLPVEPDRKTELLAFSTYLMHRKK